MSEMKVHNTQSGLSLVELAIVMFVVGILITAILVFQTLVNAAKVRAQITQLEEYKRAISTFETKYNGLPGDFNKANAYMLGNNGNGNRLIGDIPEESLLFWEHLANAKMLDFTPGAGPLPLAKIGFGYVAIYYSDIDHESFFHVGFPDDINSNSFQPLQAYTIDLKIDEGDPFNGFVLAASAGIEGFALPPTQGEGGESSPVCVNTSITPAEYNYENENNLCSLDVEVDY